MDAITYAKEDYEYLKKVTAKLRTLEEYIGDKVTVTYFRMNKVCPFLNYVPHIAEGHLTEFIPFDYVGIKKLKNYN